jgi:integrase
MSQQSFLSVDLPLPYQPDADSEQLLARFRDSRLAEGAHAQSVRREVSQLRAVMREASSRGQRVTLRALLADLDLIARVLCEPAAPISRSTGRARLLAVQRFVRVMGRTVGRSPARDIEALDACLPARRASGWHMTGMLVGGSPGRTRRRGPTLEAADLRRIVDAAGHRDGVFPIRDQALVALHCFSGLRPEEIARLRWGDLATELAANGRYGLTATVGRAGRRVTLLLPGPAADPLQDMARAVGGTVESLNGPVFCAREVPSRPLSYRAIRDVLQDAFHRTGLPHIDAAGLRAACAYWLRTQGLSDHEIAAVLGLARVRSIDRLLRNHAALDAQRTVREHLDR